MKKLLDDLAVGETVRIHRLSTMEIQGLGRKVVEESEDQPASIDDDLSRKLASTRSPLEQIFRGTTPRGDSLEKNCLPYPPLHPCFRVSRIHFYSLLSRFIAD